MKLKVPYEIFPLRGINLEVKTSGYVFEIFRYCSLVLYLIIFTGNITAQYSTLKVPDNIFACAYQGCTIQAFASNNKPKINESVKIKLSIKAPFDVIEQQSLVSFVVPGGMRLLEGSCVWQKAIKANETAEWEVVVKFTT